MGSWFTDYAGPPSDHFEGHVCVLVSSFPYLADPPVLRWSDWEEIQECHFQQSCRPCSTSMFLLNVPRQAWRVFSFPPCGAQRAHHFLPPMMGFHVLPKCCLVGEWLFALLTVATRPRGCSNHDWKRRKGALISKLILDKTSNNNEMYMYGVIPPASPAITKVLYINWMTCKSLLWEVCVPQMASAKRIFCTSSLLCSFPGSCAQLPRTCTSCQWEGLFSRSRWRAASALPMRSSEPAPHLVLRFFRCPAGLLFSPSPFNMGPLSWVPKSTAEMEGSPSGFSSSSWGAKTSMASSATWVILVLQIMGQR